MTITEAEKVRPDPTKGIQAGAAYADKYLAHHRSAKVDFDYKVFDLDLLAIDALLDPGYTMLDVGCATGGHLRLAKNHGRIVGIDFSETTIKAANELKAELGIKNVEYVVSRFETFSTDSKFDAVRLSGTFGMYQPWPISLDAIEKAGTLIKENGYVMTTHYLPRNWAHRAKATALPRHTLAITPRRFRAMWEPHGYRCIFSINHPGFTNVLFKRT